MKKLILILSSFSFLTIPTVTVVSCVIPDEEIPWDNNDEILDSLNIKRKDIFIKESTDNDEIKAYFLNQLDKNPEIKGKYTFEAMDFNHKKNAGFFIFSLTEDIKTIGVKGDEFEFKFSTLLVNGPEVRGQTRLGDFNFNTDVKVKFGSESEIVANAISEGLDTTSFFQGATKVVEIQTSKFMELGSCKVLFEKDVDLAYKKGDIFDFDFRINWTNPENARQADSILNTSLKAIRVRSDRNSISEIETQITTILNSNLNLNNKWKYYNKGNGGYLNYDSESKQGDFILEFTQDVNEQYSAGDYKNMMFSIDEKDMSDLERPTTSFYDCNFSGLRLKANERKEEAKQKVIKILDSSSKLKNNYELIDSSFSFDKNFNYSVSNNLLFKIRATNDIDLTFEKNDIKFLYYNFEFEGTQEFKINSTTKYNFIIEVFYEEIQEIINKNQNSTIGKVKEEINSLIYEKRGFEIEFGQDKDVYLGTNLSDFDDSTLLSQISKIRLVGITQKVLGDHTFNLK
ncbi:hypothetical protein [Spiroplasma alleghenense]|uniref:Lipoprotein n=1 Tax=Spiroplasma alleghenense TaxID=216931 RepID=A0A345Z4E5_9MOLU|nr:hypothetical protein [Spiroplasma alleghenense]AXK51474.1 hypothetical protein SALLE_v1c08040 [Spiroplasma alleghenense]